MTRHQLLLAPLPILLVCAGVFALLLTRTDPAQAPMVQTAPATVLPSLDGLTRDGRPVPGIEPHTLQGHLTLLNIWASWCVPCREEVPRLQNLAEGKHFTLVGIDYRDTPEHARRFLTRYGNPFDAIGVDEDGRAALTWGVDGVPETFIIASDGRIVFRLVGAISAADIGRLLQAAVEQRTAHHQ